MGVVGCYTRAVRRQVAECLAFARHCGTGVVKAHHRGPFGTLTTPTMDGSLDFSIQFSFNTY